MPPIDLSRISRLLPQFLQENQDVAMSALNLATMADSNGQPDAEDAVLNPEEITRFVETMQIQTPALTRGLEVLKSQRLSLMGSVENIRQILTSQQVGEQILSMLPTAAASNGSPEALSLVELDLWTRQLEQNLSDLSRLNVLEVEVGAQNFMRELEKLEREHPENFFPADEAGQRAKVSLHALRWLTPSDWQQIENVAPPQENEDPATVTPEVNFCRGLASLVLIGEIDRENPAADWSIDFAKVESRFNTLREQGFQAYATPEQWMADIRYVARQVSERVNDSLAQRILSNPGTTASGISLQPLVNNPLAAGDARVDFFLEQAGGDGILTRLELQDGLIHYYGGSDAAPTEEGIIDELKLLITAHTPQATAVEPVNFRREMSMLVLEDLRRMQSGFTNRDRQIMVEGGGMFGWGQSLIQGASWTVTLGGRTTGGKLYNDVTRDAVETADSLRQLSLAQLRDLIENPSLEFQGWLSARGSDPHSGAIPEALAFLRETSPRHYEVLNGQFFQAQRLWDIRNVADAKDQALYWLGFAQQLREGHWNNSHQVASYNLNNLDFARSILNSLSKQSTVPFIRRAADTLYRDSMGWDIMDDDGNVLQETGGEIGFMPSNWFKNFSDEAVATAPGDIVLMAGSIYAGGAPAKFFQRGLGRLLPGAAALRQAGRQAIGEGVGRFFGVRAAQAAEAVEVAELRTLGEVGKTPGWLGRRVANAEAEVSAARREVNQLQGQVRAAAATEGADTVSLRASLKSAEKRLVEAQQLASRRQSIQSVLTFPIRVGNGAVDLGRELYRGNRLFRWPAKAIGWALGPGLMRVGFGLGVYNRLRPVRNDAAFQEQMNIVNRYRINLPEPQTTEQKQ